eukprot:TRINITY_DN67365_c5_g2_i2.p1 TRINITY_DN67365_c5_g2~~TRINITY_DN67365_c5_g2_i2.p1  ORF type:complete len:604 (+),score=379.12 TRINITY_DN67365_c5_g2_i2:144-1814(+)
MKKLARENPHMLQRTKKDPGVPALFPFKEEVLRHAERQRDKEKERRQVQKDARRDKLAKRRRRLAAEKNMGMAAFAARAFAASAKNDARNANAASAAGSTQLSHEQRKSRGWYYKELRKVIERADVLLEVLDARDPLGCRCTSVERMVLGQVNQTAKKPKRIILVLNKIDLVPAENVAAWVKYLRREFPVIAFKASTQQQRTKLTSAAVNAISGDTDNVAQSLGVGANAMMSLLKQYCLAHKIKTAITVGIIGYPNVGKSSVINTMKRQRSVGVGSTPGFTKTVQHVKLDKHVQLLDSPGVLFSTQDSDADLMLRNALRIEQVEDPIECAKTLVAKCSAKQLMQTYQIGGYNNADEFLFRVAQRRGLLKGGGVPNLDAAARAVLRDWNTGKIKYYTVPPVANDEQTEAIIVPGWGKEFDINALDRTNSLVVSSLDGASGRGKNKNNIDSFMAIQSQPRNSMAVDDDLNMLMGNNNNNNDDDDDASSSSSSAGGAGGAAAKQPSDGSSSSSTQQGGAAGTNGTSESSKSNKKRNKRKKKKKKKKKKSSSSTNLTATS